MKNFVLAFLFVTGIAAAVEAAPETAVTQADLQALLQRITALEEQNKVQAARIAELEAATKQTRPSGTVASCAAKPDEGTTTNETGRIYTTSQGFKYYLADKGAGIFEPLSESGLKITPYGYLVFEGVYSDRPLDGDYSADYVMPMERQNNSTLSMQNSMLGLQFETPEAVGGWTFTGRAEFDLTGAYNQNEYRIRWRHLYINAEHKARVLASGCKSQWSILFGKYWHLWKMVTPSEIDGTWMENAGHPYRRSPQLTVTHKWIWEDSSLEARVGMLKGGEGMGGDRDGNNVQDNSDSIWPIFEAALVYDHVAPWEKEGSGKRWLVGFGGMYGRDRVEDRASDDEYEKLMAMFAASVPFGAFTLTGQYYIGQGLGDVQAGCGQTVLYDLTTFQAHAVRAMGGFAELGYRLNADWSFALGYGFDNPFDDDIENSNGIYFFNDRAYIAAFYQVLDNFKIGLEYARLVTTYDEGDQEDHDYDANRVQFSAFYDF